jgi:hypothetical protein
MYAVIDDISSAAEHMFRMGPLEKEEFAMMVFLHSPPW